MIPILVTGGAGYVGSHTCKALAQSGYLPISYDNLSRGHRWSVKWGPFEQGDINDRERLSFVIRQYRPAAVMHFAAYTYINESIARPADYYHNNVTGSLVLLNVMRECGLSKIIFSSSCAIYGIPNTVLIPENYPQLPVDPYGMTKLVVERLCTDYSTAYGLGVISLRYFNAAGADISLEIGEEHNPETHLIPLALEAAVGVRPKLTVYGCDYDTPDGTCVRDFLHVTDLAQAHVLALRMLEREHCCAAFNLGTGHGFSVMEVIESVRRVTGRNVPIEFGTRRTGDPPVLVADSRYAQKILGWQIEHSDISTIIETAWRWATRDTEPDRRTHQSSDR